ncbi:MAG TPA: 3-hydroxyacyl-CoA dehydrogenase NAD-binding domain-containing protein, partial [Burkholderiaceae bacterium]|nr:3-hydroxyacyl-CoA dehydrogenase NAD-binding domain-containing protein [Burkholderiaceae bacterium]
MTTWYEKREDIAVLQIDHPPVNGLNAATRAAMADGLRKASSDHKISAIIITGTGTVFSGGADIREFGTQAALAQPDLLALLDRVESCNKPVIAVINGVCMGGGLELALACHYRIATADAVMALPEVKIGLIPGAGGTQRLPRAVGAEKALHMIVSGEPIKAEEALDDGLVERIVINTNFSEAMDFAHEVAERRSRPKLRFKEASLPPGVDSSQFFEQARARVAAQASGLPAPMACVEAIEAAVTLPFAQGMECEQRLFAERVVSTESKALRHMFFAQRAAARLPDLSPEALTARPLHGVAVLGFGTMGSDIAMALAASGFEVVIYDNNAAAVGRSMAACRAQWERDARQGKLTLPEVDAQMALLKPTPRIEDLSQLDLVIEAVHEDLSLKQSVFAQLGRLMKPGAVLASNTAMLDIDHIAQASGRPADVVGLHFISPVREKPLIEVVRGKKTAPDTLGTAMALAKRLKKVAVISGVCDGFIGNRMLEQYLHQAYLLVDEGASPSQVD